MKFTVLAVSTIPDTDAARNLYNTEGLDEEAIGKILFHERKQQTDGDETLRWDQRAIAAVSMLQYSRFGAHLTSMSRVNTSEDEMLQAVFELISKGDPVITWNGNTSLISLLQFRAMMTKQALPDNWVDVREDPEAHLDLCEWLSGNGPYESLDLDETARRFGYPGMMGLKEDDLWDKYLNTSMGVVGEFADLAAVNTYLMTLRAFAASGDLRTGTATANMDSFKEYLAAHKTNHLGSYARAWNRL